MNTKQKIQDNSALCHCSKKKEGIKQWQTIFQVTILWINRGKGGHYVVKRLITDPMIPECRQIF